MASGPHTPFLRWWFAPNTRLGFGVGAHVFDTFPEARDNSGTRDTEHHTRALTTHSAAELPIPDIGSQEII